MDRFLSHNLQPYTSVLLVCGFIFGCFVTVFFYKQWPFYSSCIFLIVVVRHFKPFCFVLLGFIFAIFLIWVHYTVFYKFDYDLGELKQEVSIVSKLERQLSEGYFTAKIIQINGSRLPWFKTVRANLSIPEVSSQLQEGAIAKTYVKLKPYRSRKNFLVFDSELYAFANHVYFKGKVTDIVHISQANFGLVTQYRAWLWSHLSQFKLAWLYFTLLSGDKSKIAKSDKTVMQKLGLSHTLAVSGLHIGIIYGLFFYCARCLFLIIAKLGFPFNQSIDINIFGMSFGLCAALIYVLLSGSGIPAQRAFIMLSVFIMAYVKGKQIVSYQTLLFALAAVLLLDPFSLLNAGLYFSFVAVLSIFFCIKLMNYKVGLGVLSHLLQLVIIQFVLLVALAPLSWLFFSGISICSVLTNLIFVPLLSFAILPALLAILLMSALGVSISIFAYADTLLAWLMTQLEHLFISYGWLTLPPIEWWYVAALYLSFILFFSLIWFRWLALIPLISVFGHSVFTPKILWQVDVFDVDHGTAVLISTIKHAVLYDLGTKYFGRYSMFEHVVQPYIEKKQLTLNHVILSHQDNDHVGGIEELLKFSGRTPLKAFHHYDPSSSCLIKKEIVGILSIESLWPDKPMLSDNNNSCVVKISDGRTSILLPGDIEKRAEQILLQRYGQKLQSDILLAPHHGSKTSSSHGFLDAVSPKVAIYSRAYHSIWHLPNEEVVKRYNVLNVKQYDTAIDGHIRIKFTKSDQIIETARGSYSYWFL